MLSKQKMRRKLAQADFTDDVMFGLVMSQLSDYEISLLYELFKQFI